MKNKQSRRTCSVSARFTPEEFARIKLEFGKTNYRFFSEYFRVLLMRKPATVKYRNASLDEFLPVALQIKHELEEVRKTFTSTINTLQTYTSRDDAGQTIEFLLSEEVILKHTIERIRSILVDIYEKCRE